MLYLLHSNIIYKDRKKKLTFKENFTVPFQVFEDTFDIELLFLEKSEFGKFMKDKTEFLAKGTITLSYQSSTTCEPYVDVDLYLDYRKKYKKI